MNQNESVYTTGWLKAMLGETSVCWLKKSCAPGTMVCTGNDPNACTSHRDRQLLDVPLTVR
jgi:hypothetical protein